VKSHRQKNALQASVRGLSFTVGQEGQQDQSSGGFISKSLS